MTFNEFIEMLDYCDRKLIVIDKKTDYRAEIDLYSVDTMLSESIIEATVTGVAINEYTLAVTVERKQ